MSGKRKVRIEGMMCQNCAKHVKEALEGTDGVSSVEVDLEAKAAIVALSGDVADEVLSKAIADAGYEVTGVELA